MDGKEVRLNVLSAKLSIYIKSSETINLLRREIVNGKLGKFKVAAFPDTFAGVFPVHYLLKTCVLTFWLIV